MNYTNCSTLGTPPFSSSTSSRRWSSALPTSTRHTLFQQRPSPGEGGKDLQGPDCSHHGGVERLLRQHVATAAGYLSGTSNRSSAAQ